MQASARDFETIGSRLGFRLDEARADRLRLVWRGARFPALLCLGIAVALLFLSVPILQAIWSRGIGSRVGSLWYFPLMNLILLGIALFLLSLKRAIVLDRTQGRALLSKAHCFRRRDLALAFADIDAVRLGPDAVHSGFSVAGSTASESFPAPSLRLVLKDGTTVLVDRGGQRRLETLGRTLAEFLERPLVQEK
jgi:hypothetical protein